MWSRLQHGYAAMYNGIFTTIDRIPFPWFVNLFARRYVPYSRKTDKPIARGTGHGSCQARMKNYLARTRDPHPRTSVRSLWAHQPCISAPRKDSHEAVWRSLQPSLAWSGKHGPLG